MSSGVYGTAEFEDGMEEVEEPTPSPIATPEYTPLPVATAAPVVPAVPATPATPETPVDNEDAVTDSTTTGNEGLSLAQKALFLAVIFGVVAVYIRMNTRSSSRGAYSHV